jgi:hypothetical protein
MRRACALHGEARALRERRRHLARAPREPLRFDGDIHLPVGLRRDIRAQRDARHMQSRRNREVRAARRDASAGRGEGSGHGTLRIELSRGRDAENPCRHGKVGRAQRELQGVTRTSERSLGVEPRLAEDDVDIGRRDTARVARELDASGRGKVREPALSDIELEIARERRLERSRGEEREVEIPGKPFDEGGGIEMRGAALEAEVAPAGRRDRSLRVEDSARVLDAHGFDLEASGLEGGRAFDRETRIGERELEALRIALGHDGDRSAKAGRAQPRMPLRQVRVDHAPLPFDDGFAVRSLMPANVALRGAATGEREARVGDFDAGLLRIVAHIGQLPLRRHHRQALAIERTGIGIGDAHRALDAISVAASVASMARRVCGRPA